jgi:tetratricopeptide (TPR) repeat protein
MRAARDRFGTLNTLCFLGEAAETSGDHARALRLYRDSMRINREFVDSRDRLVQYLEGAGRLAEARGDFARALLLLVAARRERERIRVPGTPLEQETAPDFLARICERVPESAFTRAIEFARVRPFDDIVADELAIAREDDAPVNG